MMKIFCHPEAEEELIYKENKMSLSVSIVPFLLFYALGTSAAEVFARAGAKMIEKANEETFNFSNNYHLNEEEIKHLCEKEIETAIVDRETLIKTLLEHGATITGETDNCISCKADKLALRFYKKNTSEETPFSLTVSYNEEDDVYETINNIETEYAENAQEVSYNLIKNRLEEKHLTIEDEEVYEDNTIVLTVNLE